MARSYTTVTIPRDLFGRICRLAQSQRRSTRAQILFILEAWLAMEAKEASDRTAADLVHAYENRPA